jgi:hypothetical protein
MLGRILNSFVRGLMSPSVDVHTSSHQARFFGATAAKLGFKRKRRNQYLKTPFQTGTAKRMELYWSAGQRRMRVPFYQNARPNLVYDARFKQWLVMWYRHGVQVFRSFKVRRRSERFEKARMEALVLHNQLERSGKLGRSGPDRALSGVRGVMYDRQENAWVTNWTETGTRRYAILPVSVNGFDQAYKKAVSIRLKKLRENYQFALQRTRIRGPRTYLGTSRT